MRLIKSEYIRELDSLPLFYIPIEVKLHGLDNSNFSNQIKKYVRENKNENNKYVLSKIVKKAINKKLVIAFTKKQPR